MAKLPDTSDTEKMALIGRQTVLRKARRERAQEMRDIVVPILNNFDSAAQWDMTRLTVLIAEINAITQSLDDLC